MRVQFKPRAAKSAAHQLTALIAPLLTCLGLLCGQAASATTIVPLGLNNVVEQSGMIFEGRVIDLQTESTGVEIKRTINKDHSAPAQMPDTSRDDDEDRQPAPPFADPQAPVGLGVEGGRMLFTRVTMLVGRDIGGGLSASTVTFKVAGGRDGDTEVTVAGMPKFELDERYVVFLRDDHERDAAPIVGVNQGFFKVVADANGADQLLTHGGDVVVAIEQNELVVRQNPANVRATDEQPEPAPSPGPGSHGVQVQASPQVARYFSSNEPPMAIVDFAHTVAAIKEAQK